MSIKRIISKLQEIHTRIPGIVSTPATYPGALNTAQLPCVLVVPGRAVTRQLTSGRQAAIRSERSYQVRIYVEAVGQNDYDTPSQRSMELLELFLREYYTVFPLLEGFAELSSITDSGIISGGEYVSNEGLTYAGQQYRGFLLTLVIVEVL